MPPLPFFAAPLLALCLVASPRAHAEGERAGQESDLTLMFTGDINFAGRRSPADPAAIAGDANPLRRFAPVFDTADLVVVNAEGLLTEVDPAAYGHARLNIGARPAWAAAFAGAGVDLVSVANNHALDGGAAKLLESLGHLRSSGATVIGAGATAEEARAPWRLERDGRCVSVLPATLKSNRPPSAGAALAYYRGARGLDQLLAEVRAEDARGCFVVVYIHWGWERDRHRPSRSVIAAGERLVGAGADLVVGHHTHMLQGVAFSGEAAIAYGLGNFVFTNRDPDKRRTGVLRAQLAPAGAHGLRLAELALIPALIDTRGFTPRPASERQAGDLLRRLRDYSAPLGTEITRRAGRLIFTSR